MATFYGPWVSTDDFRAILDATVSNTSATQCTVTLTIKIQSNYASAGQSGRCSVTCDGTTRQYSVSYSAGRTTTLTTQTFTVSRGASARSISVSGRVWQLNFNAAYSQGSTASGSVSIPAIAYSAPAAPSSVAASRVTDSQVKVTWRNGSTSTTQPRSATLVERATDSAVWVQVASVGADATSWTDNSTSANHRYEYRVRAQGAGGYSSYAQAPSSVYTTPAAPRSVSAAATGSGTNVSISVDSSNVLWATSWEVQSQLNGGPWTAVGKYTSFPVTADIGGGTVRVRARSLRGSLASAWTTSAAITTVTPPLAPSVSLSPSGVVTTGTRVTVSWVPNHPDGSAQTQAQVAYKVGSAAERTATVSGTARSYQLPASATSGAATVTVRVRTHGADADWGAWSGYVSVTVAEPPSVNVTFPSSDGAVVADLPLDVAWTVHDSTGVASQTLALLDATGRTLHTAKLAASARSYSLGPSTYMLANSTSYAVRVSVTGGSSLAATAERDFRTSFAEPSEPGADAVVDESDMSVELTVHAGPSSTDAGEVVTVAEHAPAGTPVPGFTVYGATRQNLWVNPSGTSSGITVTSNADGAITLSGTSSVGTPYVTVRSYILRPSTSYTLSIDKAFSYDMRIGCRINNVFTGFSLTTGQTSMTFTTPATLTTVEMGVLAAASTTVSGTYRVMLNEGSEAQPWCPPGLNGVDELSIVTAGKNLWQSPATQTKNGITFTQNDDGSVTLSGTSTKICDFGVVVYGIKPGTTYTLSVDKPVPGLASGNGFYFDTADTGSKYVGNSQYQTENTFVAPGDAAVTTIGFYIPAGTTVSGTYHPQLELGPEATDWVSPTAYHATPIDLDGHTLNSLPDGTRDELTIDGTGAVTLVQRVGDVSVPSGTALVLDNDANYRFNATITSEAGTTDYENGYCDKLPVSTTPLPMSVVHSKNADMVSFYANKTTYSSSDTAKTAVQSILPARLLYELATPQTIKLPSVTLPSWPEGEANLWASSPVPTEMRVDYPDVSSLTVQRVNSDGTLWVVGDGLADGETVVDPLPPLNVPTDYVVTAHTAAGAASELRVTESVQALVGAFNFGSAASTCELARLDPEWSSEVARSGTLYHFADGGEGGGLPVAYGGQDVDATGSMGFTLLDLDQLRRLRDLARRYFTCWYRDPYGGRALVAVSWDFSSAVPYDLLKVAASMTETVFEEAW